MQESVSDFYTSANSSHYVGLPLNMTMDREIGHATSSYLANCPQPSYATSYATNFSAPYATGEIHNSASPLHNGYSRISGDLAGAHVPSSTTVAYGFDGWKEKLATDFKKLNALHFKLEEKLHDLATIKAYEAYNKKREEEREK